MDRGAWAWRVTAFGFLAGAVVARVCPPPLWPAPWLAWWLGTTACVWGVCVQRPRSRAWAVAGLGLAALAVRPAPSLDAPIPPSTVQAVAFTARVADVWPGYGGQGWQARIDQIDGWPPGQVMRVHGSQRDPPPRGQRLRWVGRALGSAASWQLVHAHWRPLARQPSTVPFQLRASVLAESMQRWVRRRVAAVLPPPDAGLARALLLGESSATHEEQRLGYRRLGLLHLLAISGLHFWVWSAVLGQLLRGPLRGLRWPTLVVLALLADFRPSVCRAGIALALREWLAKRGLHANAWQLWTAAWWVECVRTPAPGLGMQLSYLATAGLLFVHPGVPSRGLARWWVPSAAAALATAPLLHAWQGTLEFWSIPLTPLFALTLPIRMVASAVALLPGGGWLAAPFLALCRVLEDTLLGALHGLPGAPWVVPQLGGWQVLLGCAALLAALHSWRDWRRRLLRRLAVAMAGLLLLLAPGPASPPGLAAGPGGWVVATTAQGSWVLPPPRVSTRQLHRELLPLLRRVHARPPWIWQGQRPPPRDGFLVWSPADAHPAQAARPGVRLPDLPARWLWLPQPSETACRAWRGPARRSALDGVLFGRSVDHLDAAWLRAWCPTTAVIPALDSPRWIVSPQAEDTVP